jgi:hypothetical protein
MSIAVGVRCVGREPATIWTTITSLRRTGFGPLHFFVDGPFDGLDRLAAEGQVTWRSERIGGWPNFLLALTELHLGQPEAGHYLLVEDDVVFCADVAAYLEPDLGRLEVASLYTSTRVERAIRTRGAGFSRLDPGWNVASGTQALVFSSTRVEQFLASDFVRGYRHHPPADLDPRHFRRDGLHHADCVVGRFAQEAGCGIQYHYPSLVQHTGEHSFMYPGFTGKRASRCSADFPGESVSALTLK